MQDTEDRHGEGSGFTQEPSILLRASTLDGTPSGPGAFFLRRSLSLAMSNSSSDTGGTTTAAASGGASGGGILGGSNGPGFGNNVPNTRFSSPWSIAEVRVLSMAAWQTTLMSSAKSSAMPSTSPATCAGGPDHHFRAELGERPPSEGAHLLFRPLAVSIAQAHNKS
ncbi:hypothetical protein ACJJTC_015205 [Scirpophaga incertulas]